MEWNTSAVSQEVSKEDRHLCIIIEGKPGRHSITEFTIVNDDSELCIL
jgi:hypothetical protein